MDNIPFQIVDLINKIKDPKEPHQSRVNYKNRLEDIRDVINEILTQNG
ncbi:MAG: hypothetical protein WD512_08735 [Candidatus Paceibacterota bacterium]